MKFGVHSSAHNEDFRIVTYNMYFLAHIKRDRKSCVPGTERDLKAKRTIPHDILGYKVWREE
jgi:hypothetical protein